VPLASFVQGLILAALPAGGQRTARRNAWAGMSADATPSRAGREAEAALVAAVLRAGRQRTGT